MAAGSRLSKEMIVLAHKLAVAETSRNKNVEIGILKVKNADNTWNVQLKARGDYVYGCAYHGSFQLAVDDCVTLSFYEGDRQRPFIMGPASYRSGATITDYTYNKG